MLQELPTPRSWRGREPLAQGAEALDPRVRIDREPLLVDCDVCEVRGDGCADCMVTALVGAPPSPVELDAVEQEAVRTLARAGLVPPLRIVDPDSVKPRPPWPTTNG